jgi:hypothetical protein
MGLWNWMSGGRADDERCADIVRQYLTTHGINSEQWTGVKGESAVRIYAGEGTRAGRKVGFYAKLDEADMKPTGVVIPQKYGLATYAHQWRRLWAMDRRGPLYQFILRQMPGEYEDLDASLTTTWSGTHYANDVIECLKSNVSLMFLDGLPDPAQTIKFFGVYDKFMEHVAVASENNIPAKELADIWFDKLNSLYMLEDKRRLGASPCRPRISMTQYGVLDEEQLPNNAVTHIPTFLKMQKNLTPDLLMLAAVSLHK